MIDSVLYLWLTLLFYFMNSVDLKMPEGISEEGLCLCSIIFYFLFLGAYLVFETEGARVWWIAIGSTVE